VGKEKEEKEEGEKMTVRRCQIRDGGELFSQMV
jgi:hypothetical protein